VLLSFAKAWDKVQEQLLRNKPLQNWIGWIVLHGNEGVAVLCSALVATVWETKNLDVIWPLRAYPDVRPADFPTDLDSATWYNDLADFIDYSLPGGTASQK
jgi:hypothetical protein